MTDARVHDPARGDWARCAPLVATQPVSPRQGGMVTQHAYGAVAGVVGVLARSVMSGKPKNPRTSWVVSVRTKLPTGYSGTEKDEKLKERERVLESPNELREWLRNPH
jgi:hypothetical protein